MATTHENNKRINNLGHKMALDLAQDAKVTIDNDRIDIIGISPVTLALSVGYWLEHSNDYDIDWLVRFMTNETAD